MLLVLMLGIGGTERNISVLEFMHIFLSTILLAKY